MLKSGLLFRSGELPRTTDADLDTLSGLGMRTVVNFLTEAEIDARGADRLPDGVREIHLPITGDVNGIPDAAEQLVMARSTGDFRKFPPEFNHVIHGELVSGIADGQYAALFEVLADPASVRWIFIAPMECIGPAPRPR